MRATQRVPHSGDDAPHRLHGRLLGTGADRVEATQIRGITQTVNPVTRPARRCPPAATGGSIRIAAARLVPPGSRTVTRPSRRDARPRRIGVRSSSLERALTKLVEVPVSAGDVVVRQGDPADRFYVIVRGAFAVSQISDAGTEVELRRLGPDDVFGELGLLRGGARTATVSAESDGLLLALDRSEFLALVGRAESLRGRLLGLYEASSGG